MAIFAATALQTMAEPVTKDIAYLQAMAFLQGKGVKVDNEQLEITEGPAMQDGNAAYYVVNNGDDGGFVIIAGDDRSQSILGYSEQGHYDLQAEEFTAAGEVMQSYAAEMKSFDAMGITEKVSNGMLRTKTPTSSAIQPLVSAKWGQKSPFNSSTPTVDGSHCPVGCMSVAVSQVIYYYKDRMAAKLATAIPGYSSGGVTAKGVAAGTAFNWNNMFDVIDATTTAAQKTNVANLLYYVALAIKSSFSKSGTNAGFQTIGSYLTQYFGFANSDYRVRSNYTYEQWKKMIIDELEQGRPVIYYCGKEATTGHLFVVDGYDGEDLFHVNWGWMGRSNGYFTLSVLNPYDFGGDEAGIINGVSYLYKSMAFFDIQPKKGYNNVDNNTWLYAINNSFTASSNTLKVTYTNRTANKNSFTCGLGYKDSDDNIQVLKVWSNGETAIASGATSGAITYTLSASDFSAKKLTTKKYYNIYPISKIKGGDWQICQQSTSGTYLSCYYASTTSITASLKSAEPILSLAKIEYPGPKTKGAKQFVKATVKNDGDDFSGTIYLHASTSSSKGSALSSFPVYVPAGKSVTLYLYFTPKYNAKYNVWLASGANATNVFGTSTVTISDGSYSQSVAPGGLSLKHTLTSKKTIGTTIEGTIKVNNKASKEFANLLKIELWKLNSAKTKYISNDREVFKFLKIAANGSADFDFKFENLDPADTYALFCCDQNGNFWTSSSYYLGIKVTHGVMCYDKTGEITNAFSPAATITIPADALFVDFTGTTSTVSKVVPNAAKNTIYYFDDSDKQPSGLTGKNVVLGNKAANITLSNSEPMFVKKRFNATNISFTLRPTVGMPLNGVGGWQTVVIPFAPTSVTCDNVAIDWFRSKTDERKNFWLKEFAALQGKSTVCFDFVQEIKANTPYLYSVPNSKWGEANNLVGKDIVFSAKNVLVYEEPIAVAASSAFNFRGTYSGITLNNIYTLDAQGTKFVKGNTTVKPFTCYFVATENDMTDVNALNIASLDFEEATGIDLPNTQDTRIVDVYSLGGVKVATAEVENGKVNIQDLPKGVYVIQGRKVVR